MLPNWLYGKSKSKLAELLGGGGTPSDYNQVKAQVTQNTESIALLNSAVDAKVAWSDYAQTGAVNMLPTDIATQVFKGATITHNSDGSYSVVKSTADSDRGNIFSTAFTLKAGTYYWSASQHGHSAIGSDNCYCFIKGIDGTPYWYRSTDFDENHKWGVITLTQDSSIQFGIKVDAGTSNFTFYPMITPASYTGPYVPYAKTNHELTDDVAIKSSEITVNTTNVNSESISRNYVNKSAGIKVLVLQAKPKADLVVGTTYELGTVPSDYLPSLSTGFIKEDVVNSTGSTALIEISSGKLKLTPRVNNLSAAYSFTISVVYV